MRLSVLFNYTNPAPSGHRKPREIHQNQWKRAKIAKNRPWSLLQGLPVPPGFQTKRKFSYGTFSFVLVPKMGQARARARAKGQIAFLSPERPTHPYQPLQKETKEKLPGGPKNAKPN